jgi:hypothetical protein
MHDATSTHYLSPRQGPSLVAHVRKSWSPVVALAWPGHGNGYLSPRQGFPTTGGHKGPNPAQLLSRPYARLVTWPFSLLLPLSLLRIGADKSAVICINLSRGER